MDKFNLVKQFSRELTSTLELNELAKVVNRFAVVELGAEHSSIVLSGNERYSYSSGEKIFDKIEGKTFKYIMKVRKMFRIAKPNGEYMLKDIEGIQEFGYSIFALPLITKNQVMGSLNLYFSKTPDDELVDFLDLFAELSSSSIMNSLSYRNLEEKSVTDKLTGLYNRRNFDTKVAEEIEKCSSANVPFSVMMIDIDNFKEYNDEHGHQRGDEVLIKLGKEINSCLCEGMSAFRYGGEEITVILSRADPNSALEEAEKLRKKVESSCRVTVSVGLVTCMNSSCSASVMVREADNALYTAKKKGKNRVSASIIIDKALSPIDVQKASEIGMKK